VHKGWEKSLVVDHSGGDAVGAVHLPRGDVEALPPHPTSVSGESSKSVGLDGGGAMASYPPWRSRLGSVVAGECCLA
jgi:hypothetical protein